MNWENVWRAVRIIVIAVSANALVITTLPANWITTTIVNCATGGISLKLILMQNNPDEK